VTAPDAEWDAEALRIFLRLTRPRPLADPYPLYARLLDLAPLLPIRFPGVANGFVVSTFAGCSRLLRDPAFGPPTVDHLDALRPGWRENAFTRCLYRSMPLLTGQGHRVRRHAAAHHFSVRYIETYRGEMERVADSLLDGLDAAGAVPAVDLVERLALPFASLTLGRMLGIADDEAIRLGRLTRETGGAFEQFATARQHARTAAAGTELVGRLTALVRAQGAASDVLASLAGSSTSLDRGASRTRGVSGDEEELIGGAVLLFAAGVDSPASMVGLGTQHLLGHKDQANLLRQQPELAPGAVAEILRCEPPVQLVARAALRPAELEGRPIPAGSMVFGLIAAANRDPAQVKSPEVFDITRPRAASLSFGGGPHYCLGAYLAGMQGEIVFPRLLRRFPRLRPAGDPAYRAPGTTLRGLDRLPLTLK
jgi:cytochrome P450